MLRKKSVREQTTINFILNKQSFNSYYLNVIIQNFVNPKNTAFILNQIKKISRSQTQSFAEDRYMLRFDALFLPVV